MAIASLMVVLHLLLFSNAGTAHAAVAATLHGAVKPMMVLAHRDFIRHANKNYLALWSIRQVDYCYHSCVLVYLQMADSMEIMVLSMLGSVLGCEWGLDTSQQALLTTVVFCGFLIGSPLLGTMADKFGRKTVINLHYLSLISNNSISMLIKFHLTIFFII